VDKKNTFIGVLFIAAAIASIIYSRRFSEQVPQPSEVRREVAKEIAATGQSTISGGAETVLSAADHPDRPGSSVATLENDYIQVRFTNFGGAIRDVALKHLVGGQLQYPAEAGGNRPFVFNELHKNPALGFVDFPGLDSDTRYSLVQRTADTVTYRTVLDGRLEVTRSYRLAPDQAAGTDPYQLRCETTFRNLTDKDVPPMRVAVALGTAAPVNAIDSGLQLATGYSTGESQKFIVRSQLEDSSGMFGLGIGSHDAKPYIESAGPIVWGTVKNQFFSSIYTPDSPAASLVTRRVKVYTELPDSNHKAYGVTCAAESDVPALAPHGQAVLGASLYVGPNDYHRLSNADVFKEDQDRVMQFGIQPIRFCAELLLTLMSTIHRYVGNWGISIILTTLTFKIVFLPLTLVAARSAKRMQKIMPEQQAIREKYKDNPQKMQAATLELYKRAKVNPLGGCIPMLLPMPFFWGFFLMLRNTAEMRFAPFLWAGDLSVPDTIGHLYGVPVNILPLLLGVVMIFQTKLTPAPTVDNAQAKMMKFMPLMFAVLYYNWPSAVSLYSFVNGLFTIGQQLVVNRMKDPVEALPVKSPSGRPMKNVTPGKRK
jgi:YidC/Oxa1 family membrane protein insertase